MVDPKPANKDKFAPILSVLKTHRAKLAENPDVLAIRPGYKWDDASGTAAVVLSLKPSKTIDVKKIEGELKVPVVSVEATPQEQLRAPHERTSLSDFEIFLTGRPVTFRPPKRGNYARPSPAPSLATLDEEMDVEISASPDVGWTVLRDFLKRGVKKSLTIGIYQFTAPHIFKELRSTLAASKKATLAICRQSTSERIASTGTKSEDMEGDDIIQRLETDLGARFDFVRASTGAGGAFTSSYHIKVAVADEQRFWLSSGNWQSSNQSPFDPINEPDSLPTGYDTKYNREYHAVIEHKGLAKVFEAYLDHDRELPGVESFAVSEGPELVLPLEIDAVTFEPFERFEPLRLQNERVKVTPVLTPDNYRDVVLPMIQSATESIDLQNQYINLNAAGNFAEFEELLQAILERAESGVKVRLLLRDFMELEKIDMLVAMGFDPSWFKLMKNCHAKLIVVDRKRVLLGSHNWSNEGTVSNRDASLLFEHEGIAEYLGDIFEHDWNRRGRRPGPRRQPRVVNPGDTFSASRVTWSSIYDDSPRKPLPLANTAAPEQPKPASASGLVSFSTPGATTEKEKERDEKVYPFGVNGSTGNRLFAPLSIKELAQRIKKTERVPNTAEVALKSKRGRETFDLPTGTNPNDLKLAGWAVLWSKKTPPGVKAKLKTLLDHRQQQMSARYFREIEVEDGESVAAFLTRHKVSFGTQLPARLPYYLLIVASPEDISYEFQYGLDLEYAVGRLWFDDESGAVREDAFAAYAKALVEHETKGIGARAKGVAYWGPKHAADRATELSASELITPLMKGIPDLEPIAARVNATSAFKLGKEATRAVLLELLTDSKSPAVTFTAGHGMGFDPGDASQRKYQGALLAQDFTGFGQIDRKHYLAAEDLAAGASAAGLVAFFFACFGAGTPKVNCYPDDRGVGTSIAAQSFVAALPQALLERGALAVIGHIDVAWGFSFKPLNATEAQLVPYENTIGGVLGGERVGHATRSLNSRSVRLSAELAEILMPSQNAPLPDDDLVLQWIERNDARAYILLGDPAAKVTFL